MKKNRRYWLAGSLSALAAVLITLGGLSFAQVVTPISCSVLGSSSALPNATTTLFAAGGTGLYTWSGQNLATTTNATGNQFMVNYPDPGTYAVTVTDTSNNAATCNVSVVPAGTTGILSCAPDMQTAVVGQTASFSAAGGNGTYTWSSPDLTITNPTGVGFNANYASVGSRIVTVTSGGATANCQVTVDPASTPVTPPITPGLPDTGGGYGK